MSLVPLCPERSSQPVSRVMVHLFSRLTRLISRVSRFTSPIPETGSPPPPLTEQDPSVKSKSIREPTREIIYEARSLRDDVDAWIESLQLATLEHERVQVGNRAYAYAMKVGLSSSYSSFFTRSFLPSFHPTLDEKESADDQILLLRMVFGYTRDHDKVQDAALQVLTHCSTSTALLGMSIE